VRAGFGATVWLVLAGLAAAAPAGAQALPTRAEMHAAMGGPFEPLRIAGNLWYVGASDVTAFLLTGPEGHVLLDGGFPENAPMIRANVEALGFRIEDVRLIVNSHAHFDHAGGLAELEAWSGARVAASAGDAGLLERGGVGDPVLGDATFPPVTVDEIVADGDTVRVGPVALTARVTAGHTPGCTTWTTRVRDGERELDVVFVCSVTVLPGVRLGDDPTWPGIADDFRRSFEVLEALPVDVFLASHGSFFGLAEKAARARAGAGADAFIDPERYRSWLARGRARFEERLAAERGG
jgi:metallo-beta-lactamase class B